jgi:hypothetical protein
MVVAPRGSFAPSAPVLPSRGRPDPHGHDLPLLVVLDAFEDGVLDPDQSTP